MGRLELMIDHESYLNLFHRIILCLGRFTSLITFTYDNDNENLRISTTNIYNESSVNIKLDKRIFKRITYSFPTRFVSCSIEGKSIGKFFSSYVDVGGAKELRVIMTEGHRSDDFILQLKDVHNMKIRYKIFINLLCRNEENRNVNFPDDYLMVWNLKKIREILNSFPSSDLGEMEMKYNSKNLYIKHSTNNKKNNSNNSDKNCLSTKLQFNENEHFLNSTNDFHLTLSLCELEIVYPMIERMNSTVKFNINKSINAVEIFVEETPQFPIHLIISQEFRCFPDDFGGG
ncbi:hypothetical protein SNEBB_009623 [Seison nebaliae]|nr:hypothetical protein SNEBB_009623 [Seison nebaliae]